MASVPTVWKGGPKLLEPSKWWWAMRTEPHGESMLRDILRQTLLALETLHAANVTHRCVLWSILCLGMHVGTLAHGFSECTKHLGSMSCAGDSG